MYLYILYTSFNKARIKLNEQKLRLQCIAQQSVKGLSNTDQTIQNGTCKNIFHKLAVQWISPLEVL